MQRNTALLAAILIVLIIIAVAVIASALMLRNGVPTPAPQLPSADITATFEQAAVDAYATQFNALPVEAQQATRTAIYATINAESSPPPGG